MSPLPSFGAPATPQMGAGNGPDPADGPPPSGGPTGGDTDQPDGPSSMSSIRMVGQAVQQLGQTNPRLQPLVQQMQGLIRQMIIIAGQDAPTQTPSATALPG